jgi:hypothetical protein
VLSEPYFYLIFQNVQNPDDWDSSRVWTEESHDHAIENVFRSHDLGIVKVFPKLVAPFSSRDFYDE